MHHERPNLTLSKLQKVRVHTLRRPTFGEAKQESNLLGLIDLCKKALMQRQDASELHLMTGGGHEQDPADLTHGGTQNLEGHEKQVP